MTFLRICMKGDLTLIKICYFYTIWGYTDELRHYLHPGLCEPLSMEPHQALRRRGKFLGPGVKVQQRHSHSSCRLNDVQGFGM